MKIKRLTKVIAVILALSMLPIWLFGCGGGSVGTISERFVEMMIGDGSVDSDNKYTKAYIKRIDKEVDNLVATYVEEGTWNEKQLPLGSSNLARIYENCYKLAIAWSTDESKYYDDGDILSMIETTLDNMYNTTYGEEQKLSNDGHLTAQERCDQAEYLLRTLLILDEQGEISDSNIENYASVVSAKFPIPFGKGADLARTTYIVAAYSALLGDEEMLKSIAKDWAPKLFNEVTAKEGLYADGSYIADNNISSTGSYGIIAFAEMVELLYAFGGESEYALKSEAADFLYNWAMKSIVPSLYNGKAFAGTVSSYYVDAEILGGRAVSALLGLAKYFAENEVKGKANDLRAIVKGYGESSENFVAYLSTFGVAAYESIKSNKNIKPTTFTGAFNFTKNDKTTVLGPLFSASLSLSSVRTAKYETRIDHRENDGVDEAPGGKYWYTGDGMLLIYTTKYSPDSNYWNYVNTKRIPGTTVDNGARKPSNAGGYVAIREAAGSATLGNYSVSALDFLNNMNDLRSDLVAKKAWFIFDGEIVALGTGITNSIVDTANQEQTIETVIENIAYNNYKSVTVGPDLSDENSKWTLIDNKEVASQFNAIYVTGFGGIIVPDSEYNKDSVFKCALRVTAGGNFVEMWMDHNDTESDTPAVITNKSYEYCIIPDPVYAENKAGNFFNYVAAPGYTVLANNTSVQAVKDASSGATGIVFWEAGASVEGYTASFACNMMVVEKDGKVTVSVADIRQNASLNAEATQIVLPFNVASVVSASTGITASGNVLTIDRAVAANGQSLVIELTK